MVRTTIAKDQFTDTKGYYIKEIVIITRSFHDRIYIVSMVMNTSSRSTPTSSMHNLSFTALDKNDFSVKTYLVNYQRSMNLGKLSGSHRLRKA